MSTKQTQNYGLHLWEPEDKFLRTEFNENSTKLDTALKAHDTRMDGLASTIAGKSALTKLLDVTVAEETAGPLSFDISSIQWDQWYQVVIVFNLSGSGQARVRLNNSSNASYWTIGGASAQYGGIAQISFSSYTSIVWLTPMWDTSNLVVAMGLTNTFTTGSPSGQRYSDLKTLNAAIYDPYGNNPGKFTGGKVRIYGIK